MHTATRLAVLVGTGSALYVRGFGDALVRCAVWSGVVPHINTLCSGGAGCGLGVPSTACKVSPSSYFTMPCPLLLPLCTQGEAMEPKVRVVRPYSRTGAVSATTSKRLGQEQEVCLLHVMCAQCVPAPCVCLLA
jgi:hypothetical protein